MLQWETLEANALECISRAKIFGEWLVLATNNAMTQLPETWNSSTGTVGWSNVYGYETRSSICFVPDPKHEWTI